jgi:DNA-binding NtrC family response regulator
VASFVARRVEPDMSRLCSTLSVLLIDGDDHFRHALAANLREDGHIVHEFAAWQHLPARHVIGGIGIAVVEHEEASGNDGFIFADRFHAEWPGVPILLTTCSCNPALWARAMVRDSICLTYKPLSYDEFHTLLHQLDGTCSTGNRIGR